MEMDTFGHSENFRPKRLPTRNIATDIILKNQDWNPGNVPEMPGNVHFGPIFTIFDIISMELDTFGHF